MKTYVEVDHPLTVESARRLIRYQPKTGLLFWRVRVSARERKGDIAGCLNTKGYLQLSISGVQYKAHRIAWFVFYGAWPNGPIDHINGVKFDNRIDNLREATFATNAQNLHGAMRSNRSSDLLGAHFNKERQQWRTAILVGGKRHYRGPFDTAEEAHRAYLDLKRELHPGCTI